MANKLKDAKRMEESIGMGAKGKVRILMMQELENAEGKKQKCVSSRRKPETVPVLVKCGVPRRRQQSDRTSSSADTTCSSSSKNQSLRRPGTLHRKAHQTQRTQQCIPILGLEDISIDRTLSRRKPVKRRSQIVEIVDIKCGNSDRGWSDPITNQLRRLSFTRLSD